MEFNEIFFDSNFLRVNNIFNYAQFQFSKNYSDFMDFLGSNDLIDKYRICMPEIVIEELKKQIIDSYINDINNLNKLINSFKEIYNLKEVEKINYENYINRKTDEYVKAENIKIIPIPKSKHHFEKIIKRAINKQKPFCGDSKNGSDKGFKDVLQWEMGIYY